MLYSELNNGDAREKKRLTATQGPILVPMVRSQQAEGGFSPSWNEANKYIILSEAHEAYEQIPRPSLLSFVTCHVQTTNGKRGFEAQPPANTFSIPPSLFHQQPPRQPEHPIVLSSTFERRNIVRIHKRLLVPHLAFKPPVVRAWPTSAKFRSPFCDRRQFCPPHWHTPTHLAAFSHSLIAYHPTVVNLLH